VNVLDAIGNTSLVELRAISRDLPVPILAKCEHLNPGGSVKDRIARAIVDDAEARGVLKPGATLIEATAGNTGMGLALIAAARGYGLICTMPMKMTADKRVALEALGARVVITPNAPPSHPDNFRNVAQRMADEHGYFLTDQFRNPENPRIHETTTGPEILAVTKVSAFVAGVGTGGTITGVARALRGARIVLADPIGSMLASFIESGRLEGDAPYLVEGIGGSEIPATFDTSLVHAVERISDEESFATARRLWRQEGLLVGGSAGTNVAAAIRVARTMTKNDHPVVTVLPDSWDRYRGAAWFSDR
jgi:cysteine synthase